MKLYFARHGHTDANANSAISEINLSDPNKGEPEKHETVLRYAVK